MSRRSCLNRRKLIQCMKSGRARNEAIAVLTPRAHVTGDGTAMRGGRHPEATAKGSADGKVTAPRKKPMTFPAKYCP